MDKIQYNFADSDPGSTKEMTVIMQENGPGKLDDDTVTRAFIAAAAKIAELQIAKAPTPIAAYQEALSRFYGTLIREIFNDPKSDEILKSMIGSPDGGEKP